MSYIVLFAEFLAERCAHNNTAHRGGGREVSLAGLSPGGVNSCTNIVNLLVAFSANPDEQYEPALTFIVLVW